VLLSFLIQLLTYSRFYLNHAEMRVNQTPKTALLIVLVLLASSLLPVVLLHILASISQASVAGI
jgi:hypothetical protein